MKRTQVPSYEHMQITAMLQKDPLEPDLVRSPDSGQSRAHARARTHTHTLTYRNTHTHTHEHQDPFEPDLEPSPDAGQSHTDAHAHLSDPPLPPHTHTRA